MQGGHLLAKLLDRLRLFLALLLVPFAQRFQLNAQLLVFSAQGFHCLEIDAHPGTDLVLDHMDIAVDFLLELLVADRMRACRP